MQKAMQPELVLGLVCLGFLVIMMGIYFAFLSKVASRYWAIRRRARTDCRDARGTAHLQLLRQAQDRASAAAAKCTDELRTSRQKLTQLELAEANKLRLALERHIVHTFFDQVQGIGSTLKARILSSVFRGHLSDLKRAHSVQGVGEERQRAINKWIRQYEARIPALLETPYPGKDQILGEYSREKRDLETAIDMLEKRQARLNTRMKQIHNAIVPLEAVSVSDFVKALRDPMYPSVKTDRYLRGVFAEWEPVPDWFKEAISEESD